MKFRMWGCQMKRWWLSLVGLLDSIILSSKCTLLLLDVCVTTYSTCSVFLVHVGTHNAKPRMVLFASLYKGSSGYNTRFCVVQCTEPWSSFVQRTFNIAIISMTPRLFVVSSSCYLLATCALLGRDDLQIATFLAFRTFARLFLHLRKWKTWYDVPGTVVCMQFIATY